MSSPISSGAMVGAEATAAEQSRMELQAKLNGLGGLNGRQLDPQAKAKKLREACEGFESIFIQKMWQEMRNAVPKTGLLTGREEKFWQDMYDQELSKSMTKAGGIGLADMMYEQLSRNLVSASRSAAGLSQGSAFVPEAAPLIPNTDMPDQLAPPAPAAVYESEAPQMGNIAGAVANNAAPVQESEAAGMDNGAASEKLAASQGITLTGQEPVATKPANAAAIYGAAANSAHATRGKIHAADLGQSAGLLNAKKAMREAGDKLGSRAVRPAQSKSPKAAPKQEEPQLAGMSQAGGLQPGSPEALKAAMEMAKSPAESPAQPVESGSMATLVANVQAKNAAAEQLAAQGSEAVTRKVRRTTNIPQRSNAKPASPKRSDVIRTLNVDNVGVNSKAGQGLKAYQAQKETQETGALSAPRASAAQADSEFTSQAIPPLTAQGPLNAQTATPTIPPLTARSERNEEGGNPVIPPLTASRS